MHLIEMGGLWQLLKHKDAMHWNLIKWAEKDFLNDDEFFYQIIEKSGNHLLLKIWLILRDYHHSLYFEKDNNFNTAFQKLLHAIHAGNEQMTLLAYRELRKTSAY